MGQPMREGIAQLSERRASVSVSPGGIVDGVPGGLTELAAREGLEAGVGAGVKECVQCSCDKLRSCQLQSLNKNPWQDGRGVQG